MDRPMLSYEVHADVGAQNYSSHQHRTQNNTTTQDTRNKTTNTENKDLPVAEKFHRNIKYKGIILVLIDRTSIFKLSLDQKN